MQQKPYAVQHTLPTTYLSLYRMLAQAMSGQAMSHSAAFASIPALQPDLSALSENTHVPAGTPLRSLALTRCLNDQVNGPMLKMQPLPTIQPLPGWTAELPVCLCLSLPILGLPILGLLILGLLILGLPILDPPGWSQTSDGISHP